MVAIPGLRKGSALVVEHVWYQRPPGGGGGGEGGQKRGNLLGLFFGGLAPGRQG